MSPGTLINENDQKASKNNPMRSSHGTNFKELQQEILQINVKQKLQLGEESFRDDGNRISPQLTDLKQKQEKSVVLGASIEHGRRTADGGSQPDVRGSKDVKRNETSNISSPNFKRNVVGKTLNNTLLRQTDEINYGLARDSSEEQMKQKLAQDSKNTDMKVA